MPTPYVDLPPALQAKARELVATRIKVTPSGCHEWTGNRRALGYGTLSIGGQTYSAHRVSLEIAKGWIPDGYHAHHECENPPCINPEHLDATTPQRNTLLGRSSAAANATKRFCHKGHPLTGENVYHPPNKGPGARECRTCHREIVRSNRLTRPQKELLARLRDAPEHTLDLESRTICAGRALERRGLAKALSFRRFQLTDAAFREEAVDAS